MNKWSGSNASCLGNEQMMKLRADQDQDQVGQEGFPLGSMTGSYSVCRPLYYFEVVLCFV